MFDTIINGLLKITIFVLTTMVMVAMLIGLFSTGFTLFSLLFAMFIVLGWLWLEVTLLNAGHNEEPHHMTEITGDDALSYVAAEKIVDNVTRGINK